MVCEDSVKLTTNKYFWNVDIGTDEPLNEELCYFYVLSILCADVGDV